MAVRVLPTRRLPMDTAYSNYNLQESLQGVDILSVKLSKHIYLIHVYYIFRAATSMLSLGSHERPVTLNNSVSRPYMKIHISRK